MRLFVSVMIIVLLGGCASRSDGDASAQDDPSRTRESARIHTELAARYYEQGKFAFALEEVAAALNKDSDYAPAYDVRGLVHMALLEDEDADRDFRRSLDLDDSSSSAHNNYGWFLCQRGREAESVKHFMAAVKNPLYSTPEKAFLNAGLCSKKAGKLNEAELYLKRALVMQPKMPEALLGMAELSYARADYAGAKSHFIRYSQEVQDMPASSLLLAARIEHKLGNRNAEASYKMQLRNRFPDSREAQLILSGE